MLKKIKNVIKENYLYILTLLVLLVVLNIRLPYVIYTPGGIEDMRMKFEITGTTYESKGSFNLVYVTEYQATIPLYLIALINPTWEIVPLENLQYTENETIEDINFKSDFNLEQVNQYAIYNAYNLLDKEIKILNTKYYILSINKFAKTNLKIGDELLAINDVKIQDVNSIVQIIQSLEVDDIVKFKVKRKGKEEIKEATVYEKDGNKYLGIEISSIDEYEENPKLEFKFDENESGSSAGLVTTLAIYDALTEDDLTSGKKIVCTGTIDKEGNVNPIGSAIFKLHSAVSSKADIFLVPDGNYEEIMNEVKENNYDIDVYSVKNLTEAIEILNSI